MFLSESSIWLHIDKPRFNTPAFHILPAPFPAPTEKRIFILIRVGEITRNIKENRVDLNAEAVSVSRMEILYSAQEDFDQGKRITSIYSYPRDFWFDFTYSTLFDDLKQIQKILLPSKWMHVLSR